MNCKKCNTELLSDAKFCPSCGTSIQQSTTKNSTNLVSNKNKRIGFSLICFFALFVFIGNVTSQSQKDLSQNLYKSYKNHDVKLYLSLFSSDVQKADFANEAAKETLTNISYPETYFTQMVSTMAKFPVNGVSLAKSKHMVFFTNYKLTTQLTPVSFDPSLADAKITAFGKPVDAKKSLMLMKGNYTFTGTKKYPFTTITNKVNIIVNGDYSKSAVVKIDLSGQMLHIPIGPSNVSVEFDGKATGMNLSPTKAQDFGPFSKDAFNNQDTYDKLSLSGLDLPFVTTKSVKLKDVLNFSQYNHNVQNIEFDNKGLNDYIVNIYKEDVEAFNERSTSYLKSATEQYIQQNRYMYTDLNLRKNGFMYTEPNTKIVLKKVYLNTKSAGLGLLQDGTFTIYFNGNVEFSDDLNKNYNQQFYMTLIYNQDSKKWEVSDNLMIKCHYIDGIEGSVTPNDDMISTTVN